MFFVFMFSWNFVLLSVDVIMFRLDSVIQTRIYDLLLVLHSSVEHFLDFIGLFVSGETGARVVSIG